MKLFLKIIGGLFFLVVIGISFFMFSVSPNSFKPQIQKLASEKGVSLTLEGDLSWTFWPNIGFGIEEVGVAHTRTPNETVATLHKASLLLALQPLFKNEFQVTHIIIDGLSLNLHINKDGKTNWEDFLTSEENQKEQISETQTTKPDKQLSLEIERLELNDAIIMYTNDMLNQKVELNTLSFLATNINLDGRSIETKLNWDASVETTDLPNNLIVKGELINNLILDKSFNSIHLTRGNLKLGVGSKQLKGAAFESNKPGSDKNETTTLTPLSLDYDIKLTELDSAVKYSGEIQLASMNARKLLAQFGIVFDTANASAISALSYSSQFEGDVNSLKLTDLTLALDKTTFKGSVAVTDLAAQALTVNLAGDSLNLDDYLAPAVETETAVSPETGDTPLPLEAIRKLNIESSLTLAKLRVSKLDIGNIKHTLKAKNGIVSQQVSASAYGGDMLADITLSAKTSTATSQFHIAATQVELEPILHALDIDSKVGLVGAISLQADGTTSGERVSHLSKRIDSKATFSGAQVRLSPINLEQQFCNLMNVLHQDDVSKQIASAVSWPKYTELRELAGSIVWKDEVISIHTFKAGVEQLQIGSQGKISLRDDTYDFTLPFQFNESVKTIEAMAGSGVSADSLAVSSINGCSIQSNYWLNRSISLFRCKGSFSGLSPLDDCGADSKAIRELAKDFIEYKLKDKHGAKLDEAKQKLEDKKEAVKEKLNDKKQDALENLQEKLGVEGKVSKPKDILNNYLKDKATK